MTPHNELIWLRLKWVVRKAQRRGLRFFGHVVSEPQPEAPTLAQFDQDLAPAFRGLATAVEQNVIRRVAYGGPAWLRAGLFRPSNLKRMGISNSSAVLDERNRCVYLDWPPKMLSS